MIMQRFIFGLALSWLVVGHLLAAPKLNVLLFTADDLNHDSIGVYGSPIKDLTPHLDRFAGQAFRFEYAYTAVAVCQPARQTMLTGQYPHRTGSFGFFPVKPSVRTLNQQLHDAGYLISTFGKNVHHQPAEQFCADVRDDKISRHPTKLAEATRSLIRTARTEGRPFFHNVNCYDPHRPFIGMQGANDLAGGEEPSRRIRVEEVTQVPGFLEDLPDIRRELAGYYTNVRRLDDAFGAVYKVLQDEGVLDNTLIIFWGGDHGMSFPFGKSNVYENSSRCALMIACPNVTKAGTVDREHLISTIDFAPTILDLLGLPALKEIDGRSCVPILKGEKLTGWDRVYTSYNAAFGNRWFPMRCVRTKEHSYIWNAWSDGQRQYSTENMSGLTWKAMVAAGATQPQIKARTDFNSYRAPEEFYVLSNDRCERKNLIDDPTYAKQIEGLRQELLQQMQRTSDPFAAAYAKRDDQSLVPALIQKLNKELQATKKAGPLSE
jgi:N-sulfoglucosamine sulfohydrolase